MTPPDNTERGTPRGQTGTSDSDDTPPWQRLAKDSDVPAGAGEGFSDRWSAGELPTTDAPGRDQASEDANWETQTIPAGSPHKLFSGQQETQQLSAGAYDPQHGGQSRQTVSALRRPGRGPRRASLQIKRFDPWSVLKLALVLGVALFFVWLAAVGVLYTVLEGMGVWDKLNGTYSSLVEGDSPDTTGEPFITAGRVFGVAAIIGAINIVLISALTTVCAFIYNVSAEMAGGLEVTLSERE